MKWREAVLAAALVAAGCGGHAKGAKGPGANEKRSGKTSMVIDGVRFDVGARARELPVGWGVTLQIRISSNDGKEHWLEANPLLLKGSYTRKKQTHAFDEGGLMVYPPKRVKIGPKKGMKITKKFPFNPKEVGILEDESLRLEVKVVGMLTLDGSIITPDVATVTLDVAKNGTARVEVKPIEQAVP